MRLFTTIASLPLLVLGATGCDDTADVGPIQEGPGEITVIDNGGPEGDTGWWPSVAFDAHDTPHISFCDAYNGDLKYATKTDKGWRVETVVEKGAVGKYTALAVDGDGNLGIAFYDQDRKYLRYASRAPGAEWQTEYIAWGLEVGMASELRFDAKGTAHLFYYIPSAKLIHAQKPRGGQWKKAPLVDATGSWSVNIDVQARDGVFWLSFVDWTFKDTSLEVGHITAGGTLDVEVVADRFGPGWQSELFFDQGAPGVIYTLSVKKQLRMAIRAEDEWEPTILLHQVGKIGAAQAQDGTLVVAYEDITGALPGHGLIRYIRRTGDKWERFSIDPEGPAGAHIDVALDSKGRLLVAYYAGDIHGLKVYQESS